MSNDTIGDQLTRIRQKLQDVIRARLRPFGSGRHNFELRPCADPDDLATFESLCEITLPPDYRRFILELGDGGAGPAYGLLSLAAALTHDPTPVGPDLLQQPFPHTDPTSAPDASAVPRAPRPGSITLCDEGPHHSHFLVITGPAHGTLWIDHTPAGGGYQPLHVTFLTWYERWLDDTLAGRNGAWWHPHRDAH